MDLEPTIAAKSDQLNADDLLSGPRLYEVERVAANDGAQQPVNVFLKGSSVPWRPCKTCRRVLVALWGKDGKQYAGRWLQLWRDPDVVFGGIKVGGIRIKAMSGIEGVQKIMLAESRGKKKAVTVHPLKGVSPLESKLEGAPGDPVEWRLSADGSHRYECVSGDADSTEGQRTLYVALVTDLRGDAERARAIAEANRPLIEKMPEVGRAQLEQMVSELPRDYDN